VARLKEEHQESVKGPVVVAHGGTGSKPEQRDGPERAAEVGLRAMREGNPVDAVVAAVAVLEDDPRFNAGTGSNLRFDGRTIEMSAGVMGSDGNYGAVAAIRDVRNPILVARRLMDLPSNILAGEPATRFARKLGHAEHDPHTPQARKRWEEMVDHIRKGKAGLADNEWRYEQLRDHWNYQRPFEEVLGDRPWPEPAEGERLGHSNDTVGAVASDGQSFAAAASTGGTLTTLLGRFGDTPTPGAGLLAGPFGAIVLTGNGDHILRRRLASQAVSHLAAYPEPLDAVRGTVAPLPDWMDAWLAVATLGMVAVGGNRKVAWAVAH
jgi:L-asparaginase / beta-aspartyl-peptidase